MSELIAEARVLVTPDTSTFRSLLIAQTAAAAKGVTVPVTITPVVTGAAAAASQSATAAGAAASKAAFATATSSAAAASAQAQLARAADILAVAERRAAAATSEVTAASIRYQATISASQATLQAFRTSLQGTDVLLVKQATASLTAAKNNEAYALSNLEVARTEAAKTASLNRGTSAQAASFAQTSRGAGAAALSMVGLRGATLAATGPFLAGAAAVTVFAKSIQLATSFNSEIAVLGATTGAAGEELTRAAEAARAFGRDITLPGVTAGDAAQTITEFSKAGLDLNDSIAATRGGLQLAQAAQLSYRDAVTLTANALNAFGLSGNQAVRVADTLANASNLAQGGIEDTALALRQAATAAEAVGVSFEDTTALLTLLAKNGLTGSDAGTALRTAFLRLVNPSKEANKILESLNVQLRDIQGNVRPEVFAEFAAAQSGLSVKTQQANAAIVFGQDAFRAYAVLAQEGTRGLTDVQAALGETGTAARIAGARMTGLAGAQENLSNQLSALGETIGQTVTPPLTLFVNEVARFAEAGNAAVGTAKELATAFAEIVPPAPAGSGFLFDIGKEIFKTGNPIGQAIRVRDLLTDEQDKLEEEVKNGGVELRDALEESGREAARGAVSFADQITGAIDSAFALVQSTLAEAQRRFRAQAIKGGAALGGQAAGLDEQFDVIVAGGGSLAEQRANLLRQAEVQAKIIENAGPDAQGVLLEARRRAQAKLAGINTQIASIDAQVAADQKAANDERARVQEDAKRERDAAFLQSQDDARTRQERSITVAGDTPGLRDDIREQKELQALITQQIAAIRSSSLSEKAKQAAIRDLRAERNKTADTIKELRQADRELREQQRQEAQDERASQLEFLTEIATLRENEAGQVSGLRAEIQFWTKVAKNAEKGSKAQRDAILTVERKKKELRDLLEQEEDLKGGKSLAEFLTENQNLFNQVASSGGISGVDPLTGFDFSASIVDKTKRLQEAAKLGVSVTGPQAKVAPADPQIERLIAALEANTLATEGNTGTGGNGGTTYAKVTGLRAKAMGDFWQARQARQMEEARFDGGGGV